MLKTKHKALELKTKTLVDSLFIWNYKTKLKWKWIEFADYKEYDYWDDVKNIDFIKLHAGKFSLSEYFMLDR